MNAVLSNFNKMRESSELDGKGLVLMDDGGSTIQTEDGPQKRQTWIAVLIPPDQSKNAITQMDGLSEEIMEEFGAAELHAHEVFQRKGPWAQTPIQQLKAVVAAVAEILRLMDFPILVQTFWKGNESHEEMIRTMPPHQIKAIKREFGIDLLSPKEAAFTFCVHRCRNYIEAEFPGTQWELFADAGMKKPGQAIRVPVRWGNSNFALVNFEDSKLCSLIQLADYVAYFMNRSQQIAHSRSLTAHEEELLDILGTRLNFVNIPYQTRPRQHPV